MTTEELALFSSMRWRREQLALRWQHVEVMCKWHKNPLAFKGFSPKNILRQIKAYRRRDGVERNRARGV